MSVSERGDYMLNFLDRMLDEPAKKASFQLRTSIKLHMCLIVLVWFIESIVAAKFDTAVGVVCFILGGVVSLILCLYIRDSYLYKLAILDACKKIADGGIHISEDPYVSDESEEDEEYDESSENSESETDYELDEWVCPKCSSTNSSDTTVCKNCGFEI